MTVALFAGPSPGAQADGVPTSTGGGAGTLTHFEAFVLSECMPCVRESYVVLTIPVAAVKGPAFPRSTNAPGATTRAGEVVFEVIRAYPLGHAARQQFAMRVTLAVTTGVQGQTYLLGTGLVDEADVAKLASMIAELSRAPDPTRSGAEISDVEAHGDNVRIGIVTLREESFVYVQAWSSIDLPRVALKPVWEVPSLFLPLRDLSALERGALQVGDKIRQFRAQ